jgi:hypothetical protein
LPTERRQRFSSPAIEFLPEGIDHGVLENRRLFLSILVLAQFAMVLALRVAKS